MSLEPIGVVTILLGLFCLWRGYRSAVLVFILLSSMGSAAAIVAGGANVQPAHLFIVFVVITALFRRQIAHDALMALRVPEPGFWFLCLTLYAVASSIVLPRFFAGATQIIPLGVSEHLSSSDGTVPLGPVSSNRTQPVYLLGDLLCFVLIAGIASRRSGFEVVTKALIAYAAANIAFAVLDVATSATGTQDLLQFMRNAQYTFHDEETVGDMRRIIGAWPEASAFAGMSLGALGFTGGLFLCNRWPALTGTLAVVTLAFTVLSTSSTGLVGAVLVLGLFYVLALRRCGLGPSGRMSAVVVVLGPPVLLVLVLAILVDGHAATRLYDYVDTLILSKSNTSSGLQRASWNAFAWQNFLDTWGLGVGLGSNRTSSFPLALLSNLGIPGGLLYLLFIVSALGRRRGEPRSLYSDVRLAAVCGCLGQLGAAMISGPTVDQGLLLYMLVALSSAEPERFDRATERTERPVALAWTSPKLEAR